MPPSSPRYTCSHAGCPKSYRKPSRLKEHQRSHTGERPFACTTCHKSYLRESHLQAHVRSHLPDSTRPYVCTHDSDCQKRFWTSQHLRVHESTHSGTKIYACLEPGCDEAFSKHHQLRSHVCDVHAPPGTKPYQCDHPSCSKSFSTNQKLRSHLKMHDDRRYTCSHPSCLPPSGSSPAHYPTWTALQSHIRTNHPPTCTHPSCDGRTFASGQNLRAHMKLHEQRDLESLIDQVDSDVDGQTTRPRKRRRGGELGRDWICDIVGCGKDFKSKKALTTHHNVTHLGRRTHVCPHAHCASKFGYKHLLERHLARIHCSSALDETSSEDVSDDYESSEGPILSIESITGQTYEARARANPRLIQCPFPAVEHLMPTSANGAEIDGSSSSAECRHVVSRAYDLTRHLKAEHGLFADRSKVDEWMKAQKRS
ncbi:hypothetical protein CONPUDRAFT_60762 [Coniophora puteana RWD-64-598 SS2]|uniref:C2H2-type domain-containing protein n=1 Tax=Coniophora puteana (strain RWD-64-598) TaxID=741705 RepID=A0A5M3MHN3_CONPW|nr:uncharacterized protein CONPUDRAFT_60762 [Coniophora puteana RWD-64-598 SS2]EIW78739.1 hypothetical protein CONPUDRAFT_60762 [Coniophora puteana RWD-64-598 SS2]